MYKFIALLSLLLVSNLVSASAVMVDAPAFKASSAEHDNNSSKKQNNRHQRAEVDYSHIEFADHPFDAKKFKSYEYDNKFRKQRDELFLMPHRDAEHKPRHIDFDEFKRDHRGFDNRDFGHEFHDRKQDGFGDKFEYGYSDKPDTSPVPLPAAVWLFMSGLAVLVRVGHRRKK